MSTRAHFYHAYGRRPSCVAQSDNDIEPNQNYSNVSGVPLWYGKHSFRNGRLYPDAAICGSPLLRRRLIGPVNQQRRDLAG